MNDSPPEADRQPAQDKKRCRWCGSTKVNQKAPGQPECAACRAADQYHSWENPYNEAVVKRDMSAAYRKLLGYSSSEPGPEQLGHGDDDGD